MRTEATAAANWTPLGPSGWTHTSGWNPGTGRLSAMAIHPTNPNIIYVGSPGGGLWKSTNAGANWFPLTDNNSLWMSIFAITIDPLDQNIIYVGTSAIGSFTNPIALSATAGIPAGTTISFGTNPVTPGNSSLINLDNANILAPGSYVITITGTATGATTQTRDITYTVNPGAGPAITSQPVNQAICAGANSFFAITSAGATSFQWQVSIDGGITYNNISNAGVYTGTTTATLSITGATAALNNNRYRCQLSNASCIIPTASNGALLTVRQLPTVTLAASPLTSLLPGQTTTLTATPSTATGGVITMAWLFNGAAPVPAITGNRYVVNVEHTGTYQMQIQESFTSPSLSCSNQSAIVTINAEVSSSLFIFPSPNDGRFTVSYYNNSAINTTRMVTVYDSKGAKVYNARFLLNGPYTLLGIDLQPALTGIYYIVVGDATGKKLAEGKILVH